ncbi:hypothetical protein [Mobilicoccus caccae]|uniref:Uncharacterized protein n=1 Tax=Mobilicoccus caccae TaxID=1859295 RepID=A0ABQ6IUB3_9MICO|nr:hypothetical protein [Mobilicoccus caccae]GMA41528.1 hypothetical protein GCM10025883_35730 [Mobilicoccus caccae]
MSVTASGFRTAVIRLIAVSFSIAALLGIAVLLRGGQMGDLEGRILLTTLLVGVVSIAVLCYLTPAGAPRSSAPSVAGWCSCRSSPGSS